MDYIDWHLKYIVLQRGELMDRNEIVKKYQVYQETLQDLWRSL